MKFSHARLLVTLFILLSLAFGAWGVSAAQAGATSKEPTPGMKIDAAPQSPITQFIIKYKASTTAYLHPAQASEMQTLSQVAGISLRYKRAMSGNAHVLSIAQSLSFDEAQAIATNLMTSPDIDYAVPDRILTATKDAALDTAPAPAARPLQISPNDPQYSNQWHYYETWGINAPAAWDITTGSSSVVVAVIDTGITNSTLR